MVAPHRMIPQLIANGAALAANRVRLAMGPLRGYVLLDLKGSYPERKHPARPLPVRVLMRAREEDSVEALAEKLDCIAADPRTSGVVLRFGQLHVDLATADGIRRAIQRFRASGKQAIAYFTTDIDLRGYYIATAAGELVAAESAHFMVTGIGVQVQFMKEALERWGIQADFETTGEYKAAMDPLTRSDMSEANREMLDSVLDATFTSIVEGIAESRGTPSGRVRELVDDAPFTMERARSEGLIDAVIYEDGLPEYLRSSGRPDTVTPWRSAGFRLVRPLPQLLSGTVSIVPVRGMIVPGESRDIPMPVPFIGGLQAGAETVIRSLRQAERDPQAKAIVCYIDSPGGSALASDLIWREIQRINERKPVVAYMGAVAASGGYYVATGAEHIVAHPQTLTGSIGVLGGKLVVQELYRKAGIHSVLLTRGRRAAIFTGARPFEDSERQAVRDMLEDVYARSKGRVSAGRKLEAEAVEARARGRVWTGSQALEQGLVDEMGDLPAAVDRAKTLAGLPETSRVRVTDLTPPHAYLPPVHEGVRALSDLTATVAHLNRDLCWTWMPWRIILE